MATVRTRKTTYSFGSHSIVVVATYDGLVKEISLNEGCVIISSPEDISEFLQIVEEIDNG